MARSELPIVALNSTTGLPVSGASVAVKLRSTGLNATWWTAETGGTSSTAAITTDAQGRTTAWLDRGAYNCTISGTGITTYTEPFDSAPAADNAIDALWLPDNVIATRHLGDGVVTTAELGAAAVTGPKIGAAAVDNTHLATAAKNLFPQLQTVAARKVEYGETGDISFGVNTVAETTVTHGMGVTPSFIFLTANTGDNTNDMVTASWKSKSSTQFVIRVISHVGNLNFPGINVTWMAIS